MNVQMTDAVRWALGQRWLIEPRAFGELLAGVRPWGKFTEGSVGRRALTDGDETEPPEPMLAANQILVMPLWGVLAPKPSMYATWGDETYTEWWAEAFQAAVKDPNVAGIVMDVDSPGGMAWWTEELSDLIYSARGSKPVYAVANPLAASAALWISTSAERFYATPSGTVGSHGVVATHMSIAKALENFGVEVTLIHAGQYKVEGNMFEPLGDEARAEWQRGVDESMQRFTAALARNTGRSEQEVLDQFGQGRTFSAPESLRRGLITHVGTLKQAISDMLEEVGSPEALGSVSMRAPWQMRGSETEGPKEHPVPPDARAILDSIAGPALPGNEEEAAAAATLRCEALNAEAPEGSTPAEIRTWEGEVRASSEEGFALRGVGVPYNSLSGDMNGWFEEFRPGAFADSPDDRVVLWQHDRRYVFGRTPDTARFTDDDDSMRYEASPPKAQWAKDAMESIRRGDVRHSSFAFRVPEGGDRWERRGRKLVRVVERAILIEAGPQTFAAYQDTTAAARSAAVFEEAEIAAGLDVRVRRAQVAALADESR